MIVYGAGPLRHSAAVPSSLTLLVLPLPLPFSSWESPNLSYSSRTAGKIRQLSQAFDGGPTASPDTSLVGPPFPTPQAPVSETFSHRNQPAPAPDSLSRFR